LIERITAKELTDHALETELKAIIRERDEIVQDRFDRIIERSIVLDIDRKMDLEESFTLIADALADKLQLNPNVLLQKLLDREAESSTVMSHCFAVPHIIIDGEKRFEILMVRSREGIYFSEAAPSIHAVFLLIGTTDERNYHLRALASIAQIVQEPEFERKWLKARGSDALRDLVLLGKRRRFEPG
jgi:mannitol/fructose-specific phosphotransferase system IIA component (Ntr-type)